jgi:hypothetical protein
MNNIYIKMNRFLFHVCPTQHIINRLLLYSRSIFQLYKIGYAHIVPLFIVRTVQAHTHAGRGAVNQYPPLLFEQKKEQDLNWAQKISYTIDCKCCTGPNLDNPSSISLATPGRRGRP